LETRLLPRLLEHLQAYGAAFLNWPLSPDLGQAYETTSSQVSNGNLGRWPFSGIKQPDFRALPSEDRDEIEHQIPYKVKRFKENRARKRKT
ncbi:hypothetical protein, partial [Burkholderia cepacia]|uniref:hypothetical protein n=1 Tax=Burkholderia cepacia TaxID=292 RepID=UPI0018C7BEBD